MPACAEPASSAPSTDDPRPSEAARNGRLGPSANGGRLVPQKIASTASASTPAAASAAVAASHARVSVSSSGAQAATWPRPPRPQAAPMSAAATRSAGAAAPTPRMRAGGVSEDGVTALKASGDPASRPPVDAAAVASALTAERQSADDTVERSRGKERARGSRVVGVGCRHRRHPGDARGRPLSPPRRPCTVDPRGAHVEHRLDRGVGRVRRDRVGDARPRSGRELLRGLRDREEPVGRQPLRLRAAVPVLRRTHRAPAPGAVLGRDRRAGVPRDLHRGRRRAALELPLDVLRVRRVPRLLGCAARAQRRDGHGPGSEPGPEVPAPAHPHHRRLPRQPLLRA